MLPHHFSLFEIIMLVCFGASWPFSIAKTWRTRQVQGKSLIFLSLVLIGYAAGIVHKLLFSRDVVIYLYSLNFLMVLTDLLLTARYQRRAA
jgi:hypothetical protein